SFGGLVAHHVAALLQQQGEEVALLVSLDSHPLAGTGEPVGEREIHGTILDAVAGSGLSPDFGEEQLRRLVAVWRNNDELAKKFVPGRYAGRLLHFAATDAPDDPAEVWGPYVDAVDVHAVDAVHADLTKPGPLKHIGEILDAALIHCARQSRKEQR
ncbi:thioesterase domain-containing protein, partial [Amycolatopsis sp.]|uniref:thioesterase domain-containing protein n=1 Tax=Amycolatopsis sp. TaxID=37632 RepID=UPI002D7E1F82